MGFNVKSLYKTDRPLTNSASSQKGLNVRSLRDEEFELKDDDDTTIGKVSYAAKSAIEHNALDSYTPKNEEERKTLHAYREFLNNRTQSQKKTRTQDQTHSNPVAKTYDIDKYAPAKTVLARYQQYTNLPKTTESSGRKPNFWDLTVNSLKRGYVNSLYGQESYKAMTGQKNRKAYYEEKLKSEDYSFIPDAWYEKALSGAMELLGQQVKQWTDKRSLAAGTAAAGTAAVAGQIGPQVLAPEEIITVPSAFFAGISAGSAASNFEIEAGLAYNEMIENGVSHETARNIAVGVGAGNAAIEMVQIDDLIKSFKILNTDDATKSVAKKIMSYLKDRGVNIASETAQEVAQETVTTVGANAANKIDKGEWAYDWGEIGQRIGETAASSAMSFGLLGTGGDVINYGVNKTANAITSKRSTPTVSTEVTTAHAETDMDADIDNAATSIQNVDVENGDKAVKNESSVSEIPTATSVPVKETTPQSSPNITAPQTISVGDTFKDAKTGNTVTVTEHNAENTTVAVDTGTKTETRTLSNHQTDNLVASKQLERMESSETLSPKDAQTYNIVVSNLKRKAEERGLLDNNFFSALQNVNLYTPSASDRALISTEFRRVFSGNTDPLIAGWLDAISADAQPVTSINKQNTPVAAQNQAVTNGTDVVDHTKGVDGLKLIDAEKSTLLDGKTLVTGVYELNSDKDFNRKSYKKESFDVFIIEAPYVKSVDGTTYGHYGIASSKTDGYMITYLPAGAGVAKADTQTKAKALLEALENALPELPLTIKAYGDKYRCYGIDEAVKESVKNVVNSVAENTDEITLPLKNKKELISYLKNHKGGRIGVTYNNGTEDVRTIVSASDTAIVTEQADGQRGNLCAKADELSYTEDGFVYTGSNGVTVSYRFIDTDSSVETMDEVKYTHLYDEEKVSKEYLNSVNTEIENAVISIRNSDIDSVPDVIDVTEMNADTIKAISELVGFDVSGYTCKIERDRLTHIEKRHGINGDHDHSLSDPKDIARMGYVINNSDTIDWLVDSKGAKVYDAKYNDRNNRKVPVIIMEKRIDGTYTISQVVPDSKKKTLWVTSARIEKAAVGSQVPNDSNAIPQPTSETPLVSSSASDNSIAQNNDIVNGSVRTDAEKDTSNLTAKPKEALKKETESGIIKENAEKDGVKPRHVGTAELQQRIKEQLADGVHAVDDITQGVGAAVSDVNVALLKMELNGEVKRKAGNRYELTDKAVFDKNDKTGETTGVITDVKDVSDVNDGEQAAGGMESDSGRHDTTRKNTVLSAVNHTLKTEIASDSGLMSMLSDRFGGDGLTALTDELITRYDEHGDIGDFAGLFSDNGKTLYDALQQEETKQAKYSLSDDADTLQNGVNAVQSAKNNAKAAKEHFGITQDFNEAGYLTVNGDLLDFSGRHWGGDASGIREVDHGDIAEVEGIPYFADGTLWGSNAVQAFLNEGNIRISSEAKGINLSERPNAKQIPILKDYTNYNNGEITVDITDENGYPKQVFEYGKRTSSAKIIGDIDNYFSNGTIPQISELNKFRYSISEDNVISVSTTEIPVKYSNINEARKAFVEYAQKNFPRNVININTRAEIGISRTGIDKFLSGNISLQKYATGFELPELLRTAKKVGEAENKKGKTSIIGYEYYDNSVNIDGKPFAVHIRVRNTDMGNKYYGHTISQAVEDIKIEPLARNSDKKTVHSVNAFGSDNDIVSQNGNTVNDKNMQNSKKYSSESEDFSNGQAGNDLLSGNSGRTADARTGKQAEAVSSYQRKLEGKKRAERKSTAKELAVKGYTEEVISGNHKYTLIKEDGYNDDMRQVVSEAKAYGKEVGFFVGSAIRKFDGQRNFKIDGIKLSDNKILIRYDGVYSPQALLIHELVHTEWDNSEMQKAKDIILSDLSESDKKEILQNGRYKDYMELYNGDEDAVWEEFIADIFAGMNFYSDDYIDTAVDYWYNDEVIDRYNPSEYIKSIDTGGNESVLDTVGFGNEYSLSGNDFDIPYNEKRQLDDYVLRKNHSSDTLKKVDCKEIGNNFYVWENNSKTDYTVVNMIEIDGNEDLIHEYREGVKNGNFRGTESFNAGANRIRNRRGAHPLLNANAERTTTYGSYDRLSVRQSESDTRRRITESGRNKQTKYALNSEGGNAEFWDEWLNLAKKYGVIPQGENSVREVHAPKKISKTQVVSRFARTMMEAGATPEWSVSEFEKSVLDGTMTHEVITDQGAKNDATKKLQRRGFAKSLDDWDEMILSGQIIGKNEMALGQMLYNQCINKQDATHAMKIAVDLANIATQAGQTVQACRLLKTMTPDCQLYSLELSVRSMQKELEQQRSLLRGEKRKDLNLTINEELATQYLKAKTEEKQNEMMDAMLQDIADQIPATLKEKFDAWRYLAMLGNLRTHGRNVLGNATFMLPVRIKNNIAWTLEHVIPKEQRTKALKSTAAGKQFAENDYTVMKEILQNGGRYEGLSKMNEMRTVFSIKPLESLRKFNSAALEWEDGIFLKHHYINAMAQCITARGYSTEWLNSRSIEANQALADVREYAMLEAQKATYRDANAVADALSKWQRKMRKSDKLYGRAAGRALEGAVPFKKTPLNIAKRGVEYSPLGLMKGIYDAAFSVKNGKKTAAQAINAIAAGLTGTAVMLLGLFLRRIGLVRGTGNGDKGEERLDSATGYQEYALMIGDSSYTIDWLAPASMPFFMGVNMWDSYEQTDKFTFENVVNAVVKMPDPLFSLSVLSSLNDIRKAGKFAETDAESYGACAWQMGVSYLGQAFPTISGQIARTIDGTQRDTYHADKTNGIPDGLERFLMKQMAKIPWLSKNLNPVIDMWGREESYGDTVGDRLIGNMISPGYYKEIDSTYLDNELRRLNQEYEGEESVFPPKIPSSFDHEKKKYIMTPTEYTRYSIVRGRTSYELADELVRSKKYRKMSAEEKQKALKSCYAKAGEKANFEILKGRGVDVSGKKKTSKTK